MTTSPTTPSKTVTLLPFGKHVLHTLLPLLFTLGGAWVLSCCITYVTDAPLQQIDRIQVLALTALLLFTQVLMNAHIYKGAPAERNVAIHSNAVACLSVIMIIGKVTEVTLLSVVALIAALAATFLFGRRPDIDRMTLAVQGMTVLVVIIFQVTRILGL